MNRITKSDDYYPKKEDLLFFDTNIWISILVSTGNRENIASTKKINKVTNLYKRVLDNQAEICTSSLVLAEFFNAYMRIEHSRFKNIYENYKRDFRPTKQFKKAAQAALTLIKENMLCNSVRKLNDKFSTLNIADIENTEIFFDVDFNDYYIFQ